MFKIIYMVTMAILIAVEIPVYIRNKEETDLLIAIGAAFLFIMGILFGQILGA